MTGGFAGKILRINLTTKDDAGVELFKTNFYKLEGWDVNNGWPTRKTLEDLSLKKVADTLASKSKLGA